MLGDNTYGQTDVPLNIEFVDLSLGSEHTCGLQRDGTVLCWGDNTYGQTNVSTNTYVQISSGSNHVCALDENSEIFCWGDITGTVPVDLYVQIFSGK